MVLGVKRHAFRRWRAMQHLGFRKIPSPFDVSDSNLTATDDGGRTEPCHMCGGFRRRGQQHYPSNRGADSLGFAGVYDFDLIFFADIPLGRHGD